LTGNLEGRARGRYITVVAVDGFELAYDRTGSGPAVVLLHGWPGDRTDHRDLVPRLDGCEVLAPDLRGFGESDKHAADYATQYTAAAQARSVADLITGLGLDRPVVFGYDVGSRPELRLDGRVVRMTSYLEGPTLGSRPASAACAATSAARSPGSTRRSPTPSPAWHEPVRPMSGPHAARAHDLSHRKLL
jgi:pimeloyl-ACP methyl ester carboxylesterase